MITEYAAGKKSPHRILLIEDNPADTTILRLALDEQQEPYILHVLADGELALKFIHEHCHGPEPCLIILDLHLPCYDGVTILRAIRSQPELAHVKVVVLTTIASPSKEAEVVALGVESCRLKPTNWNEVLTLAEELIAICKGPQTTVVAATRA